MELKYILIMMILILIIPIATATDYYFSSSTGSDANACTEASPCKTIRKMWTEVDTAGDRALFKCGDLWRVYADLGEVYNSGPNGNSSHYITWTSYGDCNSTNKPELRGSFVANSTSYWSNATTGNANVWKLNWSENMTMAQLYSNMTQETPRLFQKRDTYANMVSNGTGNSFINYTSGSQTSAQNDTYLYSVGNPYTVYGDIEVVTKGWMFYPWVSADSYWIIENLSMNYWGSMAIDIVYAHDIIIRNNDIAYIGGAPFSGTGFAILGNAIQVWNTANNIFVYNNKIHDVSDAALSPQGDTSGHNITNTVWYNNTIWNAGYGFELFQNNGKIVNTSVHHNTFYMTDSGVFQAQRATTVESLQQRCVRVGTTPSIINFTFNDNICYEARQFIFGFSSTSTGFNNTANYSFYNNYLWRNISTGVDTDMYRMLGSTDYDNLSHLNATYPNLALNSVEDSRNPFKDSSNDDFTPTAHSPVCSMSSTDSYVGSLPCDTEHPGYYFNQTGGSDSNDCSYEYPCKTITKLNTLTLVPGDSVYFARGQTWRLMEDAYPVVTSGNSTANVIYTAYGEGNKPLFIGSKNLSSTANWTNISATLWRSNYQKIETRGLGAVFANITVTNGIVSANTPTRDTTPDAQGDWYFNSTDGRIYMQSSSNPATFYGTIEVAQDITSSTDIYLWKLDNGESYVTISDLELRFGGQHGIAGAETHHITVFNNSISYMGGGGTTTRLGNCIELSLNSHNDNVSYNFVKDCYDAGITHQSWTVNDLIYNNYVGYNIIVNCAYGFEMFNAQSGSLTANITLEHNTIVDSGYGYASTQTEGNAGRSMRLAEMTASVSNVTIRNNIFDDSNYRILVKNTNWLGASPIPDYNLYYKPTVGNMSTWNGTDYVNLSVFTTSTGYDSHSVQADPLLTAYTYVPSSISPACTMSSTGSYVGALPCVGSSYYYNQSGGDDDNDCSTPALACKTITDLNTKTLNAGDTVLFARGEVWRNPIDGYPNVNFSGSATGGYITYDAYGVGDKPKFYGSWNASSTANWTPSGVANVWNSTFSYTTEVANLIFNDTSAGRREYGPSLLNAQGDFVGNNTAKIIQIYSVGNPATVYGWIEAVDEHYLASYGDPVGVFFLRFKDYLKFQNLEFKFVSGAIETWGDSEGTADYVDHIYFVNNTIKWSGGMYLNSNGDRAGNAVGFGGSSQNIYVAYNNISQVYDAAISPQSWLSAGTQLIRNHTYEYNIIDTSAYGFEYFSSASGSTTSNITVSHNTIVNSGYGWASTQPAGNSGRTLRLSRSSANTTQFNVSNNIFSNSSYVELIFAETTSWNGQIQFNNNLWYHTSALFGVYNLSPYTNYSNWKANTSQDNGGMMSNPMLYANTFTPEYNSPACNMSSTGSYVGALPCVGASYYYNQTGGDDSNDCSTPAFACKTIADLNTKTLNPGDIVYFAKGETWRLTTDDYIDAVNGSTDGRITFTSYGTGNRPLFLGSYLSNSTNNWTYIGNSLWTSNFTISTDVGNLIFGDEDSIGRRRNYSSQLLIQQGDFHYNYTDDKIYINSSTNPVTYYGKIEIAPEVRVLNFDNSNYLTFDGLDIRYGGEHGLGFTNSNQITVQNCHFRWIGGAWLTTSRYGNCLQFGHNSNNTLVYNNSFHECYDAAITPQTWYETTAKQIQNFEASYNIVSNSAFGYEYFNNNVVSGGNTINMLIHHNTFYNSGRGFNGQQTIYGLAYRMADSPNVSTNITVRDNIAYNTSYKEVEVGWDDSTHWKGTLPTFNYNLYLPESLSANFATWNGTGYATLAAFKTGTGQEANGLVEDPLFLSVDIDNENFLVPSSSSPACDAASDGSDIGALPCSEVETSNTSYIINEGYETGYYNTSIWSNQSVSGSTTSIVYQSDYVYEGAYSGKYTSNCQDELVALGLRSELSTAVTKPLQESWTGFALMVPETWETGSSYWTIPVQWHATEDPGESGISPPLAISVVGQNWTISVGNTTIYNITGNNDANRTYQHFQIAPVEPLVWTSWVFHVKWSPVYDGVLEVWKDGVLVLNRTNLPIGYNDTVYPYFKTGIYRANSTGMIFCNKTFYNDAYKVMNETGNYSVVDPITNSNFRYCEGQRGINCNENGCYYESKQCMEKINYSYRTPTMDSSGNEYTLQNFEAVYNITDGSYHAYSGRYLKTAPMILNNQSFTLFARIKCHNLTSASSFVMVKNESLYEAGIYLTATDGFSMYVRAPSSVPSVSKSNSGICTTYKDTYVNVAGTFNGTYMAVFINGVNESQSVFAATQMNSTAAPDSPFVLMRWNGNYMNISMSDAIILNKSLSLAEMVTLNNTLNATSVAPNNIVAWYEFEDIKTQARPGNVEANGTYRADSIVCNIDGCT